MKKLAAVGGVAGLAVVSLLAASGRAADHAGSLALTGQPMADITDVYAWMEGANLNLVMDVSPRDDGTRRFDPTVLYAFHLTSKAGLGLGVAGGTETRVIVRFASNTQVQAWVTDASGTKDYVAGDPSGIAGVASLLGKTRVFAGRRSDPAFFNTAGFQMAISSLVSLATLPSDPAGCPAVSAAQAGLVRNQLAAGSDDFATANVMAIVVQIDKALINVGDNTTVGVWASTHAGS